jgi:exodeoxyribonuclease III
MTIMDAFKAQSSKNSVDKSLPADASRVPEKNFFSGDGQWDKDTLMISNWNVNGIRAVQAKGELQNYFESKNPDVLILNETKIDSTRYEVDRPDKGIPSEYFQYWNFCKIKKGYSGVALFTKTKPICIKEGMGVEKHDQEGRVITAEYDKFYVVGTYVPNSGDGLVRLKYRTKEWNVDFQKYLNGLREKKNVVLTGDLNVAHRDIDLYDPKNRHK